ncbi:uncharacterized protein TNCV_4926001 [Trichonephila clavipes]|nr:uncharacterized protein TNCV_4926001 [Trichonephila clavipes]
MPAMSRYLDHWATAALSNRDWHVTSSNPEPLKNRLVGKRCTVNLSRAETTSRWCHVVVRRDGCQLRCRLRHLTMAQNFEVSHKTPSSS